MQIVYRDKESPEILEDKSSWCCEGLKNLDYSNDSDFYFDIVIDSRWNVLTQSFDNIKEPSPVISYREPGYYGESSLEFKVINNCPFCGAKIIIKNVRSRN